MKRTLTAALAAVAAVAAWAVRALMALMLAVLGWQVFMRSALSQPPSWTEELTLLAFSWAVLLAVAVGVRDGIHVRMDLLLDRLPAAMRGLMERLLLAATAFVGAYLAWAGAAYAMQSAGTTSAATAYPMPLLYASAVVCGALITLFALERLLLGAPDMAAAQA